MKKSKKKKVKQFTQSNFLTSFLLLTKSPPFSWPEVNTAHHSLHECECAWAINSKVWDFAINGFDEMRDKCTGPTSGVDLYSLS